MSFILDALKRSENERQSQVSAEFSTMTGPAGSPRAPRWLWLLGALLVVNLVVVAGVLLRPAPDAPAPAVSVPASSPPVENPAASVPVPTPAAEASAPTFADRVEEARRTRPAPEAPAPATEPAPRAPAATPEAGTATPDAPARNGIATLPTLMELQVSGDLSLPPLHIDLHVFNDDPARRFVSINMNKYREREKLREGPTVQQITREGVILDYQGRTFALFQ